MEKPGKSRHSSRGAALRALHADSFSIQEAIRLLTTGVDLNEEQARTSMAQIMAGEASSAQIAAFLVALRMKGETTTELTGLAREMRARMRSIPSPGGVLVDTCGTGGDGTKTFNISTAAAFVVAGAGVRVAKHGNRALSSQCGSADVLEALGVPLLPSVRLAADSLREFGICFLFAPYFHTAMKYALQPRREMGIRTAFNLLGPLTNPLHATVRLMGVYAPTLIQPLAEVALRLGIARGYVVCGEDGMDEITTTAPTNVCEFSHGRTRCYHIQPEDFGIMRTRPEELLGGTPAHNARLIKRILHGREHGPCRDIVVLNAAYCILAAEQAASLEEALAQARASIDEGHARESLERLRRFYRRHRDQGEADEQAAG